MALTKTGFKFVQEVVGEHTAIVLDDKKEYLVEARLTPLARQETDGSLEDFIESIRQGDKRREALMVDAMTTNETSFFRDQKPFETLRISILPKLMLARSTARKINIWCAACSSGQEPFSIAMLIREQLPELARWDINIIATDYSSEMIARCQKASFNQSEITRGLSEGQISRHFSQSPQNENEWVLNDDIRTMVSFRQLNLTSRWPQMARPDVVFMRNVLIYFATSTKQQILDNVARIMADDGYLFLGAGESTLGLETPLNRVKLQQTSVYQLDAKEPQEF